MTNTAKKIDKQKDISSDENWDSRELGADEQYVRKSSNADADAVEESLDLQMISIRLPRDVIQKLKQIAYKDGLGYQPFVRQILSRIAHGELKFR